MLVCICKGVTDKQVRAAIAGGAASVQDLRDELNLGSQCGGCVDFASTLLRDSAADERFDANLFYSPA